MLFRSQEPTGETYKVYCKRPVAAFGGSCSRHSAEMEIVKQAKLERRAAVMVEKQRLEEEILPKATERVMGILDNDEAKDADVIKIWQTTMDRIGLAAVQGIVVEGEIKVDAPIEILRRMLQTAPQAIEDVVEGELVED